MIRVGFWFTRIRVLQKRASQSSQSLFLNLSLSTSFFPRACAEGRPCDWMLSDLNLGLPGFRTVKINFCCCDSLIRLKHIWCNKSKKKHYLKKSNILSKIVQYNGKQWRQSPTKLQGEILELFLLKSRRRNQRSVLVFYLKDKIASIIMRKRMLSLSINCSS